MLKNVFIVLLVALTAWGCIKWNDHIALPPSGHLSIGGKLREASHRLLGFIIRFSFLSIHNARGALCARTPPLASPPRAFASSRRHPCRRSEAPRHPVGEDGISAGLRYKKTFCATVLMCKAGLVLLRRFN